MSRRQSPTTNDSYFSRKEPEKKQKRDFHLSASLSRSSRKRVIYFICLLSHRLACFHLALPIPANSERHATRERERETFLQPFLCFAINQNVCQLSPSLLHLSFHLSRERARACRPMARAFCPRNRSLRTLSTSGRPRFSLCLGRSAKKAARIAKNTG